jgi:hypothetical protein
MSKFSYSTQSGTQGVTAYYKDGSVVLDQDHRLNIAIEADIAYLDIDKAMLLLLMNKTKKKGVGRMKHSWLTQERKADFITNESIGGAWDTSPGAASGTFEVAVANVHLFAEGDVVMIPQFDTTRTFYITAVNLTTGVINAVTVDGAAANLSAAGYDTAEIFLMSNSFEEGSGVGTIKSEQPTEVYNYVQIMQTSIGVTTTTQHLDFKAEDELAKQRFESGVDHAFKMEKSLFFGQPKEKLQGLMNGQYRQWFMGGLNHYISSNVDTQAALTQAEFNSWLIDSTRYAKTSMIFSGSIIFEALTEWAETKLELTRNETTLGMAVTKYMTPYGDVVGLTPHRELLTGTYLGGMAFCLDLTDLEYRYLNGLDTHVAVDVQANGTKQKIDEFRTWFSMKVGQEKKHGVLDGVTSIT